MNKRVTKEQTFNPSRAVDVELQVLKHLARDAHPTVGIVDEYCADPLIFKVFKPKETLKEGDKYKTKID
jgi:SRSO17 transposase